VERLHQQMRDSLHALVTSEDWQQALAVAAQFHEYSFANTQLIWSQAVARGFQPSQVAGYRTWQKLRRQVRRGEQGLQILAPVTRMIEISDGEEERRVVGFRVVNVFDQSQTDGEPLPEVRTTLVEGDLPAQWEKMTELIFKAGFSLQVTDVERLGEANGITDWRNREVVVRAGLPGAQRFKTAVHELAHIELHEPNSQGRPNCRGIVEVEAESVAYIICAALGVDTTSYSLPYVASWSGGDLDKVAATADRVIRCAHQVITRLEAERQLEHDPSRTITTSRQDSERISLPASDGTREPDRVPVGEGEAVLRAAVSFYQDQLGQNDQARTFLKERGINDESVDRWQLGYAPASWDSLVKTLRGQGIPDEVLLETGLVGRARTGRLYDRMRGRVVFPIHDAQGSPRGFAGRLITGDGPKYLNSPETSLYKKSSLLYGLHPAVPAIAKSRQAIIVEGYTDAIAAHQAGITNTVAAGGTALTADHLETIRSIASTITLTFDGDEAGLHAAERVAELPKASLGGLQFQIAHLPAGTDPAGLIADGRAQTLRTALRNPKPLLHHLIEQTLDRYDLDEVEATVRALYAASPLIEHLTDPAERPIVIRYLARRLGWQEDHIEQALRDYSQAHHRRRELERIRGRTLT
jgi:DNA primase